MCGVFVKSLVSAWLWSISWGWYQVPINTILLLILLVFVARLSIIRSVFCSLLFTVGAFVALMGTALLFGVFLCDLSYVQETWGTVFDALQITFYLGFLYTFFQVIIYFFMRKLTNTRVPFLLFLSNMMTAALVYQLLPKNVL